MLEHRLADAYQAALRAVETWSTYANIVLPVAGRAALWSVNVDGAREALLRLDEFPWGGGWTEGNRTWARAGLDALEGRTEEAVAGFRAAIAAYRQLELHWPEARAILDAIKLLPTELEVRDWAPDARAIFERLKARPYLAMLDEALAAAEAPGAISVASPARA